MGYHQSTLFLTVYRVNFTIKRALISMQQRSIIDMDCPTTKYCVSFITAKLCQIGVQNQIQAWNNHKISGTLYMARVSIFGQFFFRCRGIHTPTQVCWAVPPPSHSRSRSATPDVAESGWQVSETCIFRQIPQFSTIKVVATDLDRYLPNPLRK